MTKGFSRRALLKNIAAGSAAAAAVGAPLGSQHAFAQYDARPWFFLTNDEARWLAAVCDVFIPEDEYPSASQAGVVDFIDLQMASPYGTGEGLYLSGPFPTGVPTQGYQLPYTPAELLRKGMEGARAEIDLPALLPGERAGWVDDLSKREGSFGDIPIATFFEELLKLTNEGYFADPIYQGNYDYAGWKMVGFPGAHAYYTSFVDKPTPQGAPPPMGITHMPVNTAPMPRTIPGEG